MPDSQKHKILLVEDEKTLAVGLEFNLKNEGYLVDLAENGRIALNLLSENKYDLVILDIMMPFIDGFSVAESIRKTDLQLPIIMLTARNDIKDRLKGLESGADDYLTKPFHLEELLLRVKGMIRRKSWYKSASEATPMIRFGQNTVNFANLTAKNGDAEFQLTVKEAMLLKYMVDNKNKIITRQELLENVWNTNPDLETRTVDNFIVRLRRYFESDEKNPRFIKSIRGEGYIFTNAD